MSHATRGPASVARGDRRQGEFAPGADVPGLRSGAKQEEAAR